MKKQTSTEWLFEKLWETPKDKLTWNALLEQAKEEAKKLIEEYRLLVPIEFGGMNIELAKQCALISVNKILSVLYERDNLYYHYLLVKDKIEKHKP